MDTSSWENYKFYVFADEAVIISEDEDNQQRSLRAFKSEAEKYKWVPGNVNKINEKISISQENMPVMHNVK